MADLTGFGLPPGLKILVSAVRSRPCPLVHIAIDAEVTVDSRDPATEFPIPIPPLKRATPKAIDAVDVSDDVEFRSLLLAQLVSIDKHLFEINSGVAMLIEGDQNHGIEERIEELKSLTENVLEVLEKGGGGKT